MLLIGTVKENWKEGEPGFVKVEYAMGELGKSMSDWMPVMTGYAGDGFGAVCLPEIESQVVIGFLHDNEDQPVVMGCLLGRRNRVAGTAVGKDNEKKSLRTKGGFRIELDEAEKTVAFTDSEGENALLLDGKAGKLTMKLKTELEIVIDGKSIGTFTKDQISLGNKVVINDDVEIEAENVSIEAHKAVTAKGKNVSLSGTGVRVEGEQLELTGKQWKAAGISIEMKADTMGKIEAGGMLELKGGMVKLN